MNLLALVPKRPCRFLGSPLYSYLHSFCVVSFVCCLKKIFFLSSTHQINPFFKSFESCSFISFKQAVIPFSSKMFCFFLDSSLLPRVFFIGGPFFTDTEDPFQSTYRSSNCGHDCLGIHKFYLHNLFTTFFLRCFLCS